MLKEPGSSHNRAQAVERVRALGLLTPLAQSASA